ncbi:MAG: sigma-70 family RNA polymerase sigma factor [Treponema sp.]|jgi:RNA polymerase sigma factor (sigma-70 family)|nr:sigma-70 family RNA polymerase sigma factor [Treponema sp.]
MEPSAEQEAAFNGIVNHHYEKKLKFCCYALGGDVSSAEDCTQDIFLILYENMDKLHDYDKLGGWLYKTAGNISKRYATSRRKEREKFALPSAGFAAGWDGALPLDRLVAKNIQTEEDRIAEEKSIDCVAAAIEKRLKPKDEQILELVFRQRKPLKDAAAQLNLTLSAVKSQSSRLRHKITALARELLAGYEL